MEKKREQILLLLYVVGVRKSIIYGAEGFTTSGDESESLQFAG